MLIHLRHEINESSAGAGWERFIVKFWAFTVKKSWRYKLGTRLARLIEYRRLPVFSRWMHDRDLPRLATRSFSEQWTGKSPRNPS
jgi:hypothetical protein